MLLTAAISNNIVSANKKHSIDESYVKTRISHQVYPLLCALLRILWLLILTSPTQANQVIVDTNTQRLLLDPSLDYIHDPQRRFKLEQLMDSNNNLQWQPGNQSKNALTMPAGVYWLKGQITNPSENVAHYILQTQYPSIIRADLYLINDQGNIQPLYENVGLISRFDNRPFPHRDFINSITLPANSTSTLIWRIDSAPLFHFKATLWSPDQFHDRNQHNQMLYGMIYGILLVMALYNTLLLFSTGEKSYLYYVLYVLSISYLLAADNGHLYQYIATGHVWQKQFFYALAYAINIMLFSQFSILFLELRKKSRQLLWIIRSFAILSAIAINLILVTDSKIIVILYLISTALVFVSALIAGIKVRSSGIISAGYFVIAILILSFSLLASHMATLGLIVSNELTENLTAMGTTAMMIFFALALADRINQLQKENNEASAGIAMANSEKLKAQLELKKSQTERIKLEQITNQAKRENRSKSDFLATLSHEIRTPMNGVLGMTELMKSTQLNEQQEHYLNTIEHSGQTLLAILNDLQDFAKIEAGRMELELANFNLETLLDDCISTFALRAVEKNINFIADREPGIELILRGDATKLQQIILNLLSNAFKFTEHGDIVLKVSKTNKNAINSIELKFEVSDSGIGLTQDEQKRLFTPFLHADDSTYGSYGGSGLGLSISKQLAELMDGDIGVISEPGKGSTFWFTARFMTVENPDQSLNKTQSSLLAGKKLLLVDPNALSADIITRLLNSWQLSTTLCTKEQDAAEAILAAEAQGAPFNIILSEYNLESGDGLHLARTINSTAQHPTPFILMAASRYLEKDTSLPESGVDLLLEKPITTTLLHDMLYRAVSDTKLPTDAKQLSHNENKHLNVLVVEDNQVNQLVIAGLLKKVGVEPDLVANGQEALSQFQQKSYDLILMDCEMPIMDGYEATTRIRAKEKQTNKRPVTIVALSAHAQSNYQQRAENAGMDKYLTKPISLDDMEQLIDSLNAE